YTSQEYSKEAFTIKRNKYQYCEYKLNYIRRLDDSYSNEENSVQLLVNVQNLTHVIRKRKTTKYYYKNSVEKKQNWQETSRDTYGYRQSNEVTPIAYLGLALTQYYLIDNA
ncbi:976_t:CDS:2, partial [Racocetra persica]